MGEEKRQRSTPDAASRERRPARTPGSEPPIPEDVEYGQLDRSVRQRLRTLSRENAEAVGRHLVASGLALEDDPELAYRHAQAAVAHGGRVDVVREAAALAAYATGRYAEALRELRTVRRLSGSADHLALEADCERGLGRPDRSIALSKSPEASALGPAGRAELDIVVAGARLDLGEAASALVILDRIPSADPALATRIAEAKEGVLRALGRDAEADELAAALPAWDDAGDDPVVVYETEAEDE